MCMKLVRSRQNLKDLHYSTKSRCLVRFAEKGRNENFSATFTYFVLDKSSHYTIHLVLVKNLVFAE